MRARIGIFMDSHWGGIVHILDVIAMISALGAIGGLPPLLNALTKYSRLAMRWVRKRYFRAATKPTIRMACNQR
jgi:hypothetical protein